MATATASTPSGIKQDITRCVGNTPLVKLRHVTAGCGATVAAKMENLNPLWSVKDRIGRAMIDAAERDGKINKDTVIIEPTSGNTGIGLAYVCAARGYKLAVTLPESMSLERRRMLRAPGGGADPDAGCRRDAGSHSQSGRADRGKTRIISCRSSSRIRRIRKFTRKTTAEEIWKDTDGQVDIVVSGVGTGGTITGVGEVLKKRKPGVKMIAVEPVNSPVITQRRAGQPLKPGRHTIQGLGAGFIPDVLNVDIIDDVVQVQDEDAAEMTRQLAKQEGLMCGISSGAAAWAAIELAKKPENKGKLIVVVLPDLGRTVLVDEVVPGMKWE